MKLFGEGNARKVDREFFYRSVRFESSSRGGFLQTERFIDRSNGGVRRSFSGHRTAEDNERAAFLPIPLSDVFRRCTICTRLTITAFNFLVARRHRYINSVTVTSRRYLCSCRSYEPRTTQRRHRRDLKPCLLGEIASRQIFPRTVDVVACDVQNGRLENANWKEGVRRSLDRSNSSHL